MIISNNDLLRLFGKGLRVSAPYDAILVYTDFKICSLFLSQVGLVCYVRAKYGTLFIPVIGKVDGMFW